MKEQEREDQLVTAGLAESFLTRGESEFHSLLEKLPVGAYTCDPTGLITYFNQNAVAMWGRVPKLNDPEDRFCGSFRLYSADGMPIAHNQCWMALALENQNEYNGQEIIVERPDGERFTVLAHANPIRDRSGALLGAVNVLVDVTERRRAEGYRLVQLGVAQVLADADSVASAAPRILEVTCRTVGWDAGCLWGVDPETPVLRCLEFWRREGLELPEFESVSRRFSFPPGTGLPGRIWERREPMWIPDVVRDTNFPRSPYAAREGLHAAFGCPIVVGDQVLGVIEFFSAHVREPDPRLLDVMAGLGNQIGQFMERKRAQDQLRRSEQELSDFFDNATMGLHWVGPDGIILRVNQAELDLLGYRRDEYVGHHVAEFHADRDRIEDVLARLVRGEEICDWEARLRCKDGSFKHVLINSNVLRDDDDRFVHTRCFTRDITEQKQAQLALRDANRRKDEFLATLAHELRNPLAPILNALQIVALSGSGDAGLQWSTGVIQRQVEHMTRLVDDLLDLSRITSDKLDLRKERIDLSSVVDAAVESGRPIIEARGHRLTITIPSEPVFLEVDPVRVSQVLGNLLNNAAKFTGRGGLIALVAERQGTDLVVTVRDSGDGIPTEMLTRIFDMFTQLDPSIERANGGLGIGLTLVKRLVEMHGGSVEARSEGLGAGSEFVVRLPAIRDPARNGRWSPSLRAGPSFPKLRILIVDDHRDAAESLGMLLGMMGHETNLAFDGVEAVEAVKTFEPDLVLMDLGLPRMNGYDAARAIRSGASGPGPMLVAVTGWGQQEDRARSRAAGFDHHLVKPIQIAALAELLAPRTSAADAN